MYLDISNFKNGMLAVPKSLSDRDGLVNFKLNQWPNAIHLRLCQMHSV